MATSTLPEEPKQLEEAIRSVLASGSGELNVRSITWQVIQHYLNGVRNFTRLDFKTGTVEVAHFDEEGHLPFKYEDIVRMYRTEIGRMMQINAAPVVERSADTLDAVKWTSTAQLTLDSLLPDTKTRKLVGDIIPAFIRYGMIGLHVWESKGYKEGQPVVPQIEIVPPWQLFPIPAGVNIPSETTGIIRRRWVPLEWLKTNRQLRAQLDDETLDNLDIRSVAYGSHPTSTDIGGVGNQFESVSGGGDFFDTEERETRPAAGEKDDTEEYVELTETWLWDESGQYVQRYIVTAHPEILLDKEYKTSKPIRPIWTARYDDTGGFYGRGFVETLLYLNVEIEKALANLFENLVELDLFGVLCVPGTLGIGRSDFDYTGKPAILEYEPDWGFPDAQPFQLQPINTGSLPGQVADLATNLLDRVGGQSALFAGDAPGRVDSAQGLGLLYETSSIPVSGPAHSLSSAIAGAYASMLDVARRKWKILDVHSLALIDDSIIGVQIDPRTGELDLKDNPIPDPQNISVNIASQIPVSKEVQKAELKESLAGEIISPMEYRIIARKKGLDLPIGNPQEWENYRKALYNAIIAFGDGETPGEVLMTTEDMPKVHLYVYSAYQAKPEFALASVAVREKFADMIEFYQRLKGQFPEQMPYPEDMLEQLPGGGRPMMPDDMMPGGNLAEELAAATGGGPEITPPQSPQGVRDRTEPTDELM